MNICVVGEHKEEITPLFRSAEFSVVEENPDYVISYGGDGTLMKAEYVFPGIPKLALKRSRVCKRCVNISHEAAIQRLREKSFITKDCIKLVVRVGDESLLAMNDVIVHNADPRHAIRYMVSVNGARFGGEIIGDGIVVATPFGSTGYYRSITDSSFEIGMGLAFNNSTEQSDHIVLREESVIALTLLRGPALVYADNQEKYLTLEEGDEVYITKSSYSAKIIEMI